MRMRTNEFHFPERIMRSHAIVTIVRGDFQVNEGTAHCAPSSFLGKIYDFLFLRAIKVSVF